MCKAHVEVAILAHRRLRRHTRVGSSANDHQHAAHNREDCMEHGGWRMANGERIEAPAPQND
jgi:hypothetical protein